MIKKFAAVLISLLAFALLFLAINYGFYYFTNTLAKLEGFTYSLPVLYGFFSVFSAIILFVLFKVAEKNTAQIGYIFLFLTGAKMAVSYLLARAILTKTVEVKTEKLNFFFIFLLFLAIEAYYTARLLNKKQ